MADDDDADKLRIDALVRQYQQKLKRAYVPPPLCLDDVSRVHREGGVKGGGALPERLFTLGRSTVARQKLLGDAAVRGSAVRHAYTLYDQLLDLLVCRRPSPRGGAAESTPELLSFAKSLRCCACADAAAAATAAALAAADAPDTRLRIQLIHDTDAQLRKLATLVVQAPPGKRQPGRLPHAGLERACMPFAITYEDSGIGPALFRHQGGVQRKLFKLK
jgi:hypothetical protein